MADASHLERMGRELKCPICLSLLNSAVSLTCNHVFCNSCIDKSMKAASNCPVCKVPFRRREIRPAPHMDNLVSVYKSMEVASGVNIFITQNAPSTKISGEYNQTDLNICEAKDLNISEDQKQQQQKRSKNASITNQKSPRSNSKKPSFPTKKRVQVSPCPTSETIIEPQNLEVGIVENDRNKPEKCLVSQKDISFEKEKPLFSPFFWLREEEDLEKSSQQTDDNQLMYTPPDAPCFSDIKDSDDEVPCKISPKKGACVLSDNANFIDSEMFDWTQRPCSPELCSNSLAMQIEDTTAHRAQENAEVTLIETTRVSPNNRKSVGKKRTAGKTQDNNGGMGASNKKVSIATETRKRKRAKKSMCEVTAVHSESGKVTYQDMQEGNKGNPLIFKGKPRKDQKFCSEARVQAKDLLVLSDGTERLASSNKTALAHVFEDLGKSSEASINLKKMGKSKSTKRTLAQPQRLGSKVKTGKSETGDAHLTTEQHNEVSQLHTDLLPSGNGKDFSDKGISRTYETNSKKKGLNSQKKVKFYAECISMDNCDGILSSANDEEAMKGLTFQEIQSGIGQSGIKIPAKTDKAISTLNGRALLKCTSSGTFHCAFCQSSQESEASGLMVHYLNGKLVADSHNARTNAIHVHKNCTEWAPNVYFEDDNVINLEAELSRSRRIRCSCCGIKGAALGCYEKSCRKSFHVTCARMIPECRWDCENFVMLCPIHASCQLPNEMPQSESKQKRKSVAERKSRAHEGDTTDGCKGRSVSQWKSQKKFKNLVLCCSALTDTEKAIVTEFENLSGVTILKNWDSSVTHVLASTDENGACRRTLKFLMGVLEGKWIMSVQWIKACMEAGELVDEQPYEISVDVHGIRDGPRLGRLRLLNKQPKLFDGCTFFFMGDFLPSYKGYLHDLVIAAGGKVLNRKPVRGGEAPTFIIYSLELPDQSRPSNGSSVLNQRRARAEALASSAGAVVATNSWILNSIAGHALQKIAK